MNESEQRSLKLSPEGHCRDFVHKYVCYNRTLSNLNRNYNACIELCKTDGQLPHAWQGDGRARLAGRHVAHAINLLSLL